MAATLGNSASRLPLIVILGATGTGKSKLALEIAARFQGEIISADSMQVYRGLDIITNKVTAEELNQAPHHLLGFLDPLSRFTVTDFRNAALPIIERLQRERKVPVVVGGTNYYIEALLWKVLIDSGSDGRLVYEKDCEVYGAKSPNVSLHCKSSAVNTSENGGSTATWEYGKGVSDCYSSAGDSEKVLANLKHCDESGVKITGDKSSSGSETRDSNSTNGRKCVSGSDRNDRDSEICSASDIKPSEVSNAIDSDPFGTDTPQRQCQVTSVSEKKRDLSGSDQHSPKRSRSSASGGIECQSAKRGGKRENCSEKEKSDGDSENGDGVSGGLTVWQGTDSPTDVLYGRLKEVDPEIAASYHPNERRKIIRSLQVWEQTGRPHSSLLKAQREQEGGSGLGGALRYPDALIFWLTCDQEVLLNRLDARVDEMIERGLLAELLNFHRSYNAQRLTEADGKGTADYTKGIFQSIGFKEFHDFLVLPEEERGSDKGQRLYEAGVAAMKLATRQYTKKQLRWIKNRFLSPSDRKVPPLYTLDATDPSCWAASVGVPAQAVVQAAMEGRMPDLKPANPPPGPDSARRNTKSRHECEVCQRVFIGDHIWLAHLKGAKHKKMVRRRAAQQKEGGDVATTAATTTAATVVATGDGDGS